MKRTTLFRTVLAVFGIILSAEANAFAVFAVPGTTVVATGQVIDLTVSNVAVPSAFGQGVPLTWKQASVTVTSAFTPDPVGALTNGTTTWNENAIAAMSDWNAVGANFRFNGTTGTGNPCVTDGNVVAGFDASVCLGILPALAVGLTRLVAVVDAPNSIRITDADVAMLPQNVLSASGAFIGDAFDTVEVFPLFDFRRTALHEFGHALGLAHPDTVFGVTPATQFTVMFSQSVMARLSADDKNGALALYPAPAGVGGGGGGGSSALLVAIFLGVLAVMKWLHGRGQSRRASAKVRRLLGIAAALAAISVTGHGPAGAEPLEALRVLDLGGLERWRAVGTLSSSVTGARIVILEEEFSGKSKTAKLGDTPMNGVRVLSVSAGEILLEVRGRPLRLAVTRGAGSESQALAAPLEAAAPGTEPALPPSAGPGRVRLTLEEFHEAAGVLRRAFISGDIVLGENEDGVFGVMIENAPPGGIIERLGLRRGDVVVAINGAPAADESAALDLLDAAAPGQSLAFAFRQGRRIGQGSVEIEPLAAP